MFQMVERYLYCAREKHKYLKCESCGRTRAGPGQDRNLWEQFGKLMFDWEEGTDGGLTGSVSVWSMGIYI